MVLKPFVNKGIDSTTNLNWWKISEPSTVPLWGKGLDSQGFDISLHPGGESDHRITSKVLIFTHIGYGTNIPGHLSNIIDAAVFASGGKFSHGLESHENSYGLEGCLLVLERYGICGKGTILHGESIKGRVYIIFYHIYIYDMPIQHDDSYELRRWRFFPAIQQAYPPLTLAWFRKVKNSYRHLLKQDQVVPDEASFFFWLAICSIETITLPETNQSALEKMVGLQQGRKRSSSKNPISRGFRQ